jgi:hypothetical protein
MTDYNPTLQMYVWPNMRFYPCTHLDRLRTTENLSEGHQHLDQSIYPRPKNKYKKRAPSATGSKDSCRCSLRWECFNEDLKITCVVNTVITQ